MIGEKTIPQRRGKTAVLVVHDALNTMASTLEALAESFAVDEVADAFETLEAIATKRYACIVCRASAAMRVEAFSRLIDGATKSPPLVFVVGKDISTDDLAYMQRSGANWLTEHAGANEVACLVRAVEADAAQTSGTLPVR